MACVFLRQRARTAIGARQRTSASGVVGGPVPVEGPEFKLDVVGIAKHDQGSSTFLLHTRVRDAELIEVLCPSLERRPIRNMQREVIETHCSLVEPVRELVRVHHQTNEEAARVEHVPCLEARLLGEGDEPEAKDFFPPSHAALSVSDREVDVSKAIDHREVHCYMLPAEKRLRSGEPHLDA